MFKYILRSVEGINWFDVGPTLLFFVAFLAACAVAIFSKKEEMDRAARLPLED